jgi:hypothetical protein
MLASVHTFLRGSALCATLVPPLGQRFEKIEAFFQELSLTSAAFALTRSFDLRDYEGSPQLSDPGEYDCLSCADPGCDGPVKIRVEFHGASRWSPCFREATVSQGTYRAPGSAHPSGS